ncbi:MAG TPA: hypothetical protein VJ960_00460, partial [Oceanipulchritudo sp.]|nr:hypothetical protein [Oceanipulchritudo sp.]
AERVVDHGHAGSLAPEGTFLSLSPASVAFYALKPTEDGRGCILRIQETTGRRTRAVVKVGGKRPRDWAGELAPFEIVSLRIPDPGKRGTIRCTTIFE